MLSVLKFGTKKSPPSDESPSSVSETRRTQLRLAQRRHRHRKEAYLDALRKEVAELRRRCRSTQQSNDNLRRYIQQHMGLSDDDLDAISDAPAAPTNVLSSPIQLPSFDTLPAASAPYATAPAPVYTLQRNESDYGMPYQLKLHSSESSFEETEYQVGVNWVLGLERVCLGHIDVVADPNGSHSHQITSQLINATSIDITQNRPAHFSDQDVSLSNLLQLSSAFALEDEITPVQAWFMLKEQGRSFGAGAERLWGLTRLLLGNVKCHEFGAVIDKAFFARNISKIFGQ